MARHSGLQRIRRAAAIGVAASLTLATSCSAGSDVEANRTSPTSQSSTSAPEPSSCATSAPTGRSIATMTSGGLERTYVRYVPSPGPYAPDAPAPLVIDLTAYAPAATEEAFSGWTTPGTDDTVRADVVGAVVVTPEPVNGVGLLTWNVDRTPGWSDDVRFVADLLDDVSGSVCIDPDRVLVSGFAIGGVMASRLACDLADRIAVVATVAGLWDPPGCAPTAPIAVISFHGTDDHFLPFDGGVGDRVGALGLTAETSAGLGAMAGRPSAPEAAAAWATRNGCTGAPEVGTALAGVERRVWSDCDAAVRLDVIDAGGHTWPGSSGMAAFANLLGPVSSAESATAVIWEFFAANA